MVVVGVIAILAAVVVPTLIHFRRKAAIGSLIKEIGGMTPALQTHYNTHSGLNGLTLDANGNITNAAGLWVAHLPNHYDVTWSIAQSTQNQLDIEWAFNSPCLLCDGVYCIECQDDVGCSISIQVQNDAYGLNRSTENIPCTPP